MHARRWRPQLGVAEALPGVVAFGIFLAWARASGGYFPNDWYAGGLVLAGVLLVAVVSWPALVARLERPHAIALLAFAGFTAWSYATIRWADVRGDAWDGANRVALYLIVFALFAIWRWGMRTRLVLMAGFAIAVCLVGMLELLAAARARDVGSFYNDGRFAAPVGYPNGNAALFVLAFWPALFLASRREVMPALRAVLVAAVGVSLQLALLAQSRGGAAAFGLTFLVYLAIVPGRLRALVHLVPPAVVLAFTTRRLLDTGAAEEGPALASGAESAATVVASSAAVLLVLGAVLALVDRRIEVPERFSRIAGRSILAAAVAAVVVATVLVFALAEPVDRVEAAWDEFTAAEIPQTGSRRLVSGFESTRSDLWRVAFDEFKEQPLTGIGAENFGTNYLQHRRAWEETLYPHSLLVQVLVQTGLVGALLFAVFLAGALVAAVGRWGRSRGFERGLHCVALIVFVYWFAHASIDWFWELPALTAPALAFLALAGGGTERPSPAGHRVTRAAVAGSIAALALITISFVFPWLAARETRNATRVWRADEVAAAQALDRARRLNPLSDRPDLVAGSIARRQERWSAMAAAYGRAVERNPHNWYAHLHLAIALALQDRTAAARRELEVAKTLNPLEPLVDLVRGWLDRREPIDVAEVTRVLDERYELATR